MTETPLHLGEKLRVLIVEDEEVVRTSLALFLRERDFLVAEAENGQLALDLVESAGTDVIISDIRMPVLDGIGLLKAVKGRWPEIKIILVTGYQDVDSAVCAARHGAFDYVTKPYNLAEIYQILRRILDDRAHKDELARKQDQLSRSQRLASLGLLATGIMHEINNPNTFIMGNAEFLRVHLLPILEKPGMREILLQESRVPLEELVKVVNSIITGAERITAIVKRTTSFNALRLNAQDNCDLRALIQEALSTLEPRFAGEIAVTLKQPDTSVPVHASHEELLQLFTNLVVNAIEAVAGKPEARIGLHVAVAEPDHDRARVTVEDNGCGIQPRQADHIFDPFVTSKIDHPGRGLGLFISHQIVQNLGGTIDYSPVPAGGSRFVVTLPLTAAAAEARV